MLFLQCRPIAVPLLGPRCYYYDRLWPHTNWAKRKKGRANICQANRSFGTPSRRKSSARRHHVHHPPHKPSNARYYISVPQGHRTYLNIYIEDITDAIAHVMLGGEGLAPSSLHIFVPRCFVLLLFDNNIYPACKDTLRLQSQEPIDKR